MSICKDISNDEPQDVTLPEISRLNEGHSAATCWEAGKAVIIG